MGLKGFSLILLSGIHAFFIGIFLSLYSGTQSFIEISFIYWNRRKALFIKLTEISGSKNFSEEKENYY
jgi:hypothetical protein